MFLKNLPKKQGRTPLAWIPADELWRSYCPVEVLGRVMMQNLCPWILHDDRSIHPIDGYMQENVVAMF